MRTFARVSLSALVLAVGLSYASVVHAEEHAKGTGTVTGRVVDADGKPVAGAHVRALAPGALKGVHDRKSDGPAAPKEEPKVEAKADTGADGTFTLENVPAGKARIIAGLKGSGVGMLREPVLVKAGETEKVGDIQLKKPAAGTGAVHGGDGTKK